VTKPKATRRENTGIPAQLKLARHNPLRALDWRFRLAEQLIASDRQVQVKQTEAELKAAVTLTQLLAAENSDSRLPFPEDSALEAHGIFQIGGPRSWEMQAWLLTGAEDDEIADRMHIPPATIAAYENLFFNVRDRLSARDWIAHTAIRMFRSQVWTPEICGAVWRRYAYYWGRQGLELVLQVIRPERPPLLPHDLEDLATDEGRLRLGIRLTVTIDVMPLDAPFQTELNNIARLCAKFANAGDREKRLSETLATALLRCPAGLEKLTVPVSPVNPKTDIRRRRKRA